MRLFLYYFYNKFRYYFYNINIHRERIATTVFKRLTKNQNENHSRTKYNDSRIIQKNE